MSKSPVIPKFRIVDNCTPSMERLIKFANLIARHSSYGAKLMTFSINYTRRDVATGKIFDQWVTTHDQHGWLNMGHFMAHASSKPSHRVTLTDNGYKELSECGTYETTVVAIEDASDE